MKPKQLCLLTLAGFVFALSSAAQSAASAPSAGSNGSKPATVDWRGVESADYRNYVNNLEAVGFPKQTIRALVTADVVAAFAGKRAGAVAARYQDFTYWQSNPAQTAARATLAAQRQTIDEEMNAVLQQLLGMEVDLPDVAREWQQEEWNQELAFLSPTKLAATKAVLLEFSKVDQQMKELAAGINVSEDTNASQKILARYNDEQSTLRQLLTPEEYRQVDVTASWTAENLRRAMVHFEPTQEEFQIIYEAWKPHDDLLSETYARCQTDPGHLEKQVYAKIKAQLSAPRYEQYRATWWK
jgi:hypothetical protein